MPSILLPLLLRSLRGPAGPTLVARRLTAAILAAILAIGTAGAAVPEPLVGSGVATVPGDAAFLFSSLRLREQFDRLTGSNAFAAIRGLPAVKRAFDSWEEQREMPGSPVSMFLTFLELPENQQAADLLADMVASDTFLYGEPSCIAFVKLLRTLQRVRQVGEPFDFGEPEMIEEEELEATVGGARILPVRRQVGLDLDLPMPQGQAEAIIEMLADNLDLVTVPDLVWGFRTIKKEAGDFQLKRLEVLARWVVEMNPNLAGSLARRKLPGGEVVTFTVAGKSLPWDEITRELGGSEALDKVVARIRGLDLVVALGTIGDWVIVSLGDSVDHLEKLVLPGERGKALVDTEPFAPLRRDAEKKLTTIWYVSREMAEAVSPTAADLDPMVDALAAAIDEQQDVPAAAAADAKALAERAREEYAAWLPQPGPWMAYSFLTAEGYEGYTWDWAGQALLDGSARLGLLGHAGGRPAAVAVSRLRSNPDRLAAVAGLLKEGWGLFAEHAGPAMDEEERARFDAFNTHVAPLGGRLADVLATKIAASLADAQVGLVLDTEASTRKPQQALPASAEPLPILEPAIVLPLKDRKLFLEGLNDLFALGDELVEGIRQVDPDAVPAGYRIPEPKRTKQDEGSVWTFTISDAGLDPQLAPAIGVGAEAVAFSLVPAQAARLLSERRLETAADLSTFDEPLAGAAAVDFPALVDAVEPWVVYLTRYGCIQQREGWVDPDRELSADDQTRQATEALEHVAVVLDAARCLKAAVAETALRDGATVTHWRNLIRDMPKR